MEPPQQDGAQPGQVRCCSRVWTQDSEAYERHRERRHGGHLGTLTRCPDCGVLFTSPNAVGPHRRAVHGYRRPAPDPV